MTADVTDLRRFMAEVKGHKVEVLKMEERRFHNLYGKETFELIDVYYKNGPNLVIELKKDDGEIFKLYEENCDDVQVGINKDTCALTLFEYDLELLMIHKVRTNEKH